MAANESTKYTHFSNIEVGSASGGGGFKVGGVQQNLNLVQTVTGALALTAADSGKTLILNAAAGANITLPALSAGLKFKFIVGAAFATTSWTVTSTAGDDLQGSVIVAGAVVDVDAADVITFVNTAENVGDFVEVFCDGTSWHTFGNALTVGGLTATG
jgi:hypothetical protein